MNRKRKGRVVEMGPGAMAERVEGVMRAALPPAADLLAPGASVLVSIMASWFPSLHQRRVERTLQEVQAAIDVLQSRGVDSKALSDSEAFYDLVRGIIEALLRAGSEEKRVRLRSLLVNAAMISEPSVPLQQAMIRLVHDLDDLHISVLQFFANPHAFAMKHGTPLERSSTGSFHDWFRSTGTVFAAAAAQDLLPLAVSELNRLGLANYSPGGECGPNSRCASPLGMKLLEFIQAPPNTTAVPSRGR